MKPSGEWAIGICTCFLIHNDMRSFFYDNNSIKDHNTIKNKTNSMMRGHNGFQVILP